MDGSIALVEFSINEIGEAISDDEQRANCRSFYGDAIHNTSGASAMVIESTAMLALERQRRAAFAAATAQAAKAAASTPRRLRIAMAAQSHEDRSDACCCCQRCATRYGQQQRGERWCSRRRADGA